MPIHNDTMGIITTALGVAGLAVGGAGALGAALVGGGFCLGLAGDAGTAGFGPDFDRIMDAAFACNIAAAAACFLAAVTSAGWNPAGVGPLLPRAAAGAWGAAMLVLGNRVAAARFPPPDFVRHRTQIFWTLAGIATVSGFVPAIPGSIVAATAVCLL